MKREGGMIQLSIRQSGGANIVSIPKLILNALNLHVGSTLDLSIINHTIVLTPVKETLTLEALLSGSPQLKSVINYTAYCAIIDSQMLAFHLSPI